MTNMADITFRNVDKEVLQNFKAEAVRENKTFGNALSEALRMWLEHKKFAQKKKMKLSDSKPLSFRSGTHNLSGRIDDILYAR